MWTARAKAQLQDDVQQVLQECMEAGEASAGRHRGPVGCASTNALKLREAPELNNNMHPAINFDVSLPRGVIRRFAEPAEAAFNARWPGQHALYFGHVGDGNLHVSVDGKTVGGECVP
ncbi:FAD-binding oxidoreductase [Staphylococcus epidermidis]|nr:FAD-binding oxidoreductase [Staphylococcus epidermidis]